MMRWRNNGKTPPPLTLQLPANHLDTVFPTFGSMALYRRCRINQRPSDYFADSSHDTTVIDDDKRPVSISADTRENIATVGVDSHYQHANQHAADRCALSWQNPLDCQSRTRLDSTVASHFVQGLHTPKHVTFMLFITCISSVMVLVASGPISREGTLLHGPAMQYRHSYDSLDYLSKFGYLPHSDMETGLGSLRNKSELAQAIRNFQRMAHLPTTGELDAQTRSMMTKERCGMSDNLDNNVRGTRSKRYLLGPSKWPKKDLTYYFTNYTPDLDRYKVRDAMERAFKLWSDATQLTFREISYGEADIMIKFDRSYHGDGYPFDGQGTTLAHAFYPGDGTEGDIHFDEDEEWTVRSEQGVNLYTVAAHELGHSLGLGHSSILGALMYPWYQGYTPDLALHSDDLVAIQYLYGIGYPDRPVHTPRPRPPTTTTTRAPLWTTTTQAPDVKPNPCTTDMDAVALIRDEAYFFKGLWFWRVNKNGVYKGYPVKISAFWYGFPDDVTKIDAVYERVLDGKIVFFSGKRFWTFNGNHMDGSSPREGRPLSDLGLPATIDKVDAAFVWGYNKKTYFVYRHMYWRYNERRRQMDQDYPRDMSMWAGVPVPVDAAFQLWDGNTYFFQGRYFWKFKDDLMRIDYDNYYQEPLGTFWLECNMSEQSAADSARTSSIWLLLVLSLHSLVF